MRLDRLVLTDFRSHRELDLDLTSISQAAVVGRNGAGKSTLFKGVEWCLYGGESGDDLLRRGAKQGGVTLEVTVDGARWRISRGRERGRKSWLVIERGLSGAALQNWTPCPFNRIDEAQDFLRKNVLAMDHDAFCASVYAPQGQAGALAAMKPAERKALLGGLLGLEEYEDWRETAASERRQANARRDALLTGAERNIMRAEDLRAELTASPIDDMRAKEEELVAKLGAAEAALTAAIERMEAVAQVRERRDLERRATEIKTEAAARKKRNEDRASLAERLKEAQKAAEGFDEAEAAHQAHQAAVLAASQGAQEALEAHEGAREVAEGARSRLSGSEDRQATAEARVVVLQGRVDAFDVESEGPLPSCPTCGQAVADDEARERLRAAREAEKARMVEELDEAKTTVESLRLDVVVARNALNSAEAAHKAAAARAERPLDAVPEFDMDAFNALRAARMTVVRVEGEIQGLGPAEDVTHLRAEFDQLKEQAEKLPSAVPEGEDPDAVRVRIRDLTESLRGVRAQIETARAKTLELASIDEALVQVREECDEQEELAAARAVVEAACSRNGIPAMILDNAVEGVEVAANEALDAFACSMRVRLATQVAKKSGKGQIETLEVLVDDGLIERPLSTFSGGEAYRVHIALRLGLARVLASASGRSVDLLLIDEPTDLDKNGVALLSDLLGALDRQVLLVTHQDELVHGLPQRVVVERPSDADPSSVSVL